MHSPKFSRLARKLRAAAKLVAGPRMSVQEALKVLDLQSSDLADPAKLKTQYRAKSREHHPDMGGDPEAMKRVNEAYEVLSQLGPQAPGVAQEDRAEQAKRAEAVVADQIGRMFRPEAFTAHFEALGGQPYVATTVQSTSKDYSGYGHYYRVNTEWRSQDGKTVFSLELWVNLADVRMTKALGGGEDQLSFNVSTRQEILHDGRKSKFRPRDYGWAAGSKQLVDPEELFPSAKIKTMLGGKEKARKFAKRDMELGLEKLLGATLNQEWATIPLGEPAGEQVSKFDPLSNRFVLMCFRTVMVKQAGWSLHSVKGPAVPKVGRAKFDVKHMSCLECPELLEALSDLQHKCEGLKDGAEIARLAEQAFASAAAKAAGAQVGGSVSAGLDQAQQDALVADADAAFPRAGSEVDGRVVRKNVDNLGSISSTFDDGTYTVLSGVREVATIPYEDRYPSQRIRNLANAIHESKEITPLILVVDELHGVDDPYILEGSHRIDALNLLGAKAFPALIVVDHGSADEQSASVTKAAATPQPTKTMQAPEVVAVLRRANQTGKQAGFNMDAFYQNVLAKGPHVLVALPIQSLSIDADAGELSSEQTERIQKYKGMPGEAPPIYASFGERSARKGLLKAFVQDGNHRAQAARLNGKSTIQVMMPEADWQRFAQANGWEAPVGMDEIPSASVGAATRVAPTMTEGALRDLIVRTTGYLKDATAADSDRPSGEKPATKRLRKRLTTLVETFKASYPAWESDTANKAAVAEAERSISTMEVKRGSGAMVSETDRSTDPTVMEYAKQFLLKRKVKTIAAAARATVRSLSGFENMMLGPGITVIDPKVLTKALEDYIRDYGEKNGSWMAGHTFNLAEAELAKLGIKD